MSIITRFAPSPTGKLHVGNIRTALINWLFAKHHNGKFILRIDDTDKERSKPEFTQAILNDMKWLGLGYDELFHQSERIAKYEAAKEELIKKGRLYPCFESQEELETKRKIQLSNGRPPIYDRAALKLSEEQQQKYLAQGRTPHYRFLLTDNPISWDDYVRGTVHFEAHNLSDPILIRGDGSMTYMLCSTVDDIEYKITDVIRGEDHISNTAIQVQLFEAMDAEPPNFGHLSLITSKDDKISKREGGFEIEALRNQYFEPMAILNLFAKLGSCNPVLTTTNIDELINDFNISSFSKSSANYMFDELEKLNHKIVTQYEFNDIKEFLTQHNLLKINEDFWYAVRPNLNNLNELKLWWDITNNPQLVKQPEEQEFLNLATKLLPEGEIDEDSWKIWTKKLANESNKSGKKLFMPLRIALTGLDYGPELKQLLPLIGKKEIIRRLTNGN